MEFQDYLKQQIENHPSIQPQDIVKLCYQAAFGAEHLLMDTNMAKAYFEREFASVPAENVPLYEEISPDVCRVSLPAWKASGMPTEWLFRMFMASASIPHGGKDTFLTYLEIAEKTLETASISFSFAEWSSFIEQYLKEGIRAVHHSEIYRNAEHPSYRIIHKKFLRLLPILQTAAKLPDNAPVKVIAIDGRAASGKTTLAGDLGHILQAGIVHMDDFFLPPSLREEKRLAAPGGNIHSERFAEEVLPFLRKADGFSYPVFDCGVMEINGIRSLPPSQWRIVEGAYSCHPLFGSYADLTVFSDISPAEQEARILRRNGAEMLEIFRKRWIPMEEKYYTYFKIKEQADIRL